MVTTRRPTISDVAREAHVSIGAVSNAVNGRKGVSEATRARVVETAARLGWTPNSLARSLMTGRTATVSLVLDRDPEALEGNEYFAGFLTGAEAALAAHDHALLLRVVPDGDEAARLRWLTSRPTDGLLLIDLQADDPRVAVAKASGIPAVATGAREAADGLPSAWIDEATAMEEVLRHLRALGHRRIALVVRFAQRATSRARAHAFSDTCERLGLVGSVYPAGPALGAVSDATRALLAADAPPTALVYDHDLGAVCGLASALAAGTRVPEDVSVIGWYDSPVATLTDPPLTAVGYDARTLGMAAAELLLDVLEGATPADVRAVVPALTVRGSTGPAVDR